MTCWDQVKAFPTQVAKIKPTKVASPVFTSKFCHFLLPRVFPVVDREGVGSRWRTYEAYFRFVQDEWRSTGTATRADLARELTRLMEENSSDRCHTGLVCGRFAMCTGFAEFLLTVLPRRKTGAQNPVLSRVSDS